MGRCWGGSTGASPRLSKSARACLPCSVSFVVVLPLCACPFSPLLQWVQGQAGWEFSYPPPDNPIHLCLITVSLCMPAYAGLLQSVTEKKKKNFLPLESGGRLPLLHWRKLSILCLPLLKTSYLCLPQLHLLHLTDTTFCVDWRPGRTREGRQDILWHGWPETGGRKGQFYRGRAAHLPFTSSFACTSFGTHMPSLLCLTCLTSSCHACALLPHLFLPLFTSFPALFFFSLPYLSFCLFLPHASISGAEGGQGLPFTPALTCLLPSAAAPGARQHSFFGRGQRCLTLCMHASRIVPSPLCLSSCALPSYLYIPLTLRMPCLPPPGKEEGQGPLSLYLFAGSERRRGAHACNCASASSLPSPACAASSRTAVHAAFLPHPHICLPACLHCLPHWEKENRAGGEGDRPGWAGRQARAAPLCVAPLCPHLHCLLHMPGRRRTPASSGRTPGWEERREDVCSLYLLIMFALCLSSSCASSS